NNQKHPLHDGMSTTNQPVTKQDLNNEVRNANGTSYPNTRANSRVFLPYAFDQNGQNPTFTGGGIYVEGDAQVKLAPVGANGQKYTYTQGNVVTSITITPASAPC